MKTKIQYEPLSILNKQIKRAAYLRKINCLFSQKKNEIRLYREDRYMGVIKYVKLNGVWNVVLELVVVAEAGLSGEIDFKHITADQDIKKYEKEFQLLIKNGKVIIRKLTNYKSKAQVESMGIVDIMDSFEFAGVLTAKLISKMDELCEIRLN